MLSSLNMDPVLADSLAVSTNHKDEVLQGHMIKFMDLLVQEKDKTTKNMSHAGPVGGELIRKGRRNF